MEFISQVSAHTGQNRKLCLSAHGRLPGTLRYYYNIHGLKCRPAHITTPQYIIVFLKLKKGIHKF